MKKIFLALFVISLLTGWSTVQAQWTKFYNSPTFGTVYQDVSNDVETDNFGNSYVAGVQKIGTSGNDLHLIKYDAAGNVLAQATYVNAAYEETLTCMITGKDTGLYLICNATATATGQSYVMVVKYDRNLIFQSAVVYSTTQYYIPKAASIDPVTGRLYVACTKKNVMGGSGELAVLKIQQVSLAIELAYTHAYISPGDGYNLNTECIYTDGSSTYVGGYVYDASTGSSLPYLIRLNSATLVSQFVYTGSFYAGRNTFTSITSNNSTYVYVTGKSNDANLIAHRFKVSTGALMNTYTFPNPAGYTSEGMKIYYVSSLLMVGGYSEKVVTDKVARIIRLDANTLVQTGIQNRTVPYSTYFNDMLYVNGNLLATGQTLSAGDFRLFTLLLNINSGYNFFDVYGTGKGEGLSVNKITGGAVVTGWNDIAVSPNPPDKRFITRLVKDSVIFKFPEPTAFQINRAEKLTISPNPARSLITVDGLKEDTEVFIKDMNGRMVFTGKLKKGNQQVDITNFQNGVYILQYENENIKFIKQ